MIVVIGIDQSLRATGITTLRAEPGQTFIERARAVITMPDNKSKHLYQADADGLRISRIKARNVTESSKGHESIAERLDRIEAKLDRLLAMAPDAWRDA